MPWVAEAARAWSCRKHGCLPLCHPDPSAVLLDAVHAIQDGVDARAVDDAHRLRAKLPSPPDET